jgi:putative membrane protein
MMGGYGTDGWSAWMLFMGIFWVVLIGLVVWAAVRLSRRADEATHRALESPRQILDRRYAAGEIDEAQYARTRSVLEGRDLDGAYH